MTARVEVVIAGGSFAGLACATALARRGLAVVVLERKKDAGTGIRTTGILVREAAELLRPPAAIVRRITDVCLYAPSLKSIRLRAKDYFFLATDTPALLRHMSAEAAAAGAEIRFDAPYAGARSRGEGFVLPGHGLSCRFLVGADGARSRVAEEFGLGRNRHFLIGAEAEFEGENEGNFDRGNATSDRGNAAGGGSAFHCFLSRKHAPGYLGWAVPGVGITQVGLAASAPHRPALAPFLRHIGAGIPALDFSGRRPLGHRGGLIPAGGPVHPFSRGNVLLLGDAAGIVSPLTGGGIHTALHYGFLLGDKIADHLLLGGPHPARCIAAAYPRYRAKSLLRFAYERAGADLLLEAVFGNPAFSLLARAVFFRRNRLESPGGPLHDTCTKNPEKCPEPAVSAAHLHEKIREIT